MGVVYLARDDRLGRSVAIKVLAPEIAADEALRTRFLREARRVAGIDHPNVVSVYDAGEDADGDLYLTMRHLRGGDLGSLLRREGRLTDQHAVEIVTRVGAALAVAHRIGLVHRDVKPGNILLDRAATDAEPFLSDFGLATVTTGRSTNSLQGQIVGTLTYMAPEQIRGDEPDPRSDVYSLGCVLYECLTGSPPYEGSDSTVMYGHLEGPLPVPSRAVPELGEHLDRVVATAMAKEPSERYQTADELVRDLSRGEHAGLSAASGGIGGRKRVALGIAVLTVLVVGAGLALRSHSGSRPPAQGSAPLRPTGRLAFSGYGHGIDVMPAGGGRPQPLTAGANDYDPQLSPDRRQLVYLRPQKGSGLPMIATQRGTGTRPLLAAADRYQVYGGFFGNDTAWSPDGARIVFVFGSARHHPASGLGTITPTGQDARVIVSDCIVGLPTRSQYRRCERTHPVHGICLFKPGHTSANTCSSVLFQSPAWAPKGHRMVFAAQADPQGLGAALWTVDTDGTHLHRIEDGLPAGLHQENPSWSPDGRLIAFNACDSQNLCSIYTMTPAGSSVRKLPAGTNVAADPRWQSNGRFIDYLCQFNRVVSICEIHPDGTGRRVVLRGTRNHQPVDLSWGP